MHYYKVTRNFKSVIAQENFCITYELNKLISAPQKKYGIMIFDNIEHAIAYIKNIKLSNLELWECDATDVISLDGMDANDKQFISTLDPDEWEAETTFPIGTCECSTIRLTRQIDLALI
jgi:hypothetical protein